MHRDSLRCTDHPYFSLMGRPGSRQVLRLANRHHKGVVMLATLAVRQSRYIRRPKVLSTYVIARRATVWRGLCQQGPGSIDEDKRCMSLEGDKTNTPDPYVRLAAMLMDGAPVMGLDAFNITRRRNVAVEASSLSSQLSNMKRGETSPPRLDLRTQRNRDGAWKQTGKSDRS